MCFGQLGEFAHAESDYSKALEIEPEFVPALRNRGRCRRVLANSNPAMAELALADFNRGLELTDDSVDLLLARRRLHLQQGRTQLARQDLEAAIEAETDSVPTLQARAELLKDIDPQLALADLQKAAELDPDDATILTSTARLYSIQLNNSEQALKLLDRALELNSNFETALIDRAVLLARKGEHAAALKDIKQALAPPNLSRTLYQAACALARMPGGENQEFALTYLSRALKGGYKPEQRLIDDDDLATLRGTNGFRAILQDYRLGIRPGLEQSFSSNDDSP
jgi:tetratricopeptide (TPR) repeat protein